MTSLLRNLAFCGTGREVPVEELGFLCGTVAASNPSSLDEFTNAGAKTPKAIP